MKKRLSLLLLAVGLIGGGLAFPGADSASAAPAWKGCDPTSGSVVMPECEPLPGLFGSTWS